MIAISALSAATRLNDTGLPGFSRVLIWFNDPGNWQGPQGLAARTGQHLFLTTVIVIMAIVIAVPIGTVIGHTGRGAVIVAGIANALRAVPGLGLLILLIVTLSPHINISAGLTSAAPPGSIPYLIPVLVVLLILAIPPILTATYAGIQSIDSHVKDAAVGIGLSGLQTAIKVELPNAVPVIVAGVRSSALQVIASLSVAAYAPLVGGLGRFISDGTQNITDPRYGYPAMVAAALTVALVAVIADLSIGQASRHLMPRGLRQPTSIRAGAMPPHLLIPPNEKETP